MFKCRSLAANLNDPLHVASFCSNQPSCYLELLVIVNLYIKSAGIFDIVLLTVLLGSRLLLVALVLIVRTLLSLRLGIHVLIGELVHSHLGHLLPITVRIASLLVVQWLLNLDVFLVRLQVS